MKKNFKLGIVGLVLSVTLIIVGICFREINFFFSLAGMFIGLTIFYFARYIDWWAGDEKLKKELEGKVEEESIKQNDERNQMIKGKALDVTFKIMLYTLTGISVILMILGQSGLIPEGISIYIVAGIVALLLVSAIIMKLSHIYFNRKY